jgi:hypothetical protein
MLDVTMAGKNMDCETWEHNVIYKKGEKDLIVNGLV